MAQNVLSFVNSIVLVKYLVKADYGTFHIIISLVNFSKLLSSFGLEQVITKYSTEFLTKGSKGVVKNILLSTLVLRVVILVLLSGAFLVFLDDIENFFNIDSQGFNLSLFLIIVFLSRINPLIGTSILNSQLRNYKDKLALLVYDLLKLISFFILLKLGYGIQGLLLAWIGLEFLILIYYLHNLAFKLKLFSSKIAAPSSDEKKRMIRFALFSFFGSSIFFFVDVSSDKLLLSHYLDASSVAIYSLVCTFINMPLKLNPPSVLRGYLSPLFTKQYVQSKSDKKIIEWFSFLMKLSLSITLPLYLILVTLSDKIIIYVYNPNYLEAVNIVFVLSFAFFIAALIQCFTPVIYAMEKNVLFLIAGAFSVLNLILNIILIPKFQVMGAAYSTTITQVLIFIFYFGSFRYYYKLEIPIPWRSFFYCCVAFIPSFVILVLLRPYIQSFIALALSILLSIGTYLIFIYKKKLFNDQELQLLKSFMGRS